MSLCLPTSAIELKCDNTAAIVLATGEGSWRTKSATKKVYAVKEKVDCGYLEVSHVSTVDQCADPLTKFLRGGQNQQGANAHLSLVKLEDWLPRRGQVTRANRVRFSDQPKFFEPRVKRVFLSGPEFSTTVGQTSFAQNKELSDFGGEIANTSSLQLP